MRDAILDRLLWVPREMVSDTHLQKLTLLIDKYDGDRDILRLYEINKDFVGVPRRWGLRKFPSLSMIDNTVKTKREWPELRVDWRSGQKESVQSIAQEFENGSYGCLLEGKTGCGKTLLGLAIAQQLGLSTLILIHKGDLAEQWHATGRKFFPGARKGHCQQNDWEYRNKHFVTAMAQTLYARRNEIPSDFWEQFGLIIYDEGHRYPAKTFEQVMRMSPARYRLAVSATWRRRDGIECVWHWHVGDVEHRVQVESVTGEYRQIIWNTRIEDKMFRRGKRVNHGAMVTAISKNVRYNRWLADQTAIAAGLDRKILLISDRKEQIQIIRGMLLAKGKTVGLYVGAIAGKRRTREQLEIAKRADIILATYGMMTEGTDVPALDTLFFGTPRAEIEQIVGRIQRPHSDKKELLIVDPIFDTQYNRALGRKRQKKYLELGFTKQEV